MKIKSIVLSGLLMAGCLCFFPESFAQNVPQNIMTLANAELQKRGLDETEVKERLLKEGIDINTINPAEYAQYQDKVTGILDEMEATKKKTKTDKQQAEEVKATTPPVKKALVTKNATAAKSSIKKTDKDALVKLSPDSVKTEVTDSVRTSAKIYGHELFDNKTFEVIDKSDVMQVSDSYILGEGDEIHISIFGASQTDIQQHIAADGSIKPADASKIFLKGLTLAQARNVIKGSLSKSYLFRDDQFAVSVVTTRTVLVNVLGETKKTGGFYLSAINSALNALNAAGGPSENGSVRCIQIVRGNTRKIVDLYEFMNDPVVGYKMDIQNNDIIYVPVIKNVVLVEGAVKRPMRYEMLDNEGIADVIRYAGGLAMNANPEYVHIQRFTGGEEKLFEWNLKDVMSGKVKVELKDGDIVMVLSIKQPLENFVEVVGSVKYPGKYDLKSNFNLGKVLDKAGFTSRARKDMVFIDRIGADNSVEMLSVNLDGNGEGEDFLLKPRDKVKVMELAEYSFSDTVYVCGEVKKPFRKILSVNNRFTVDEAINYAGGLNMTVYPVAYIFRKNLSNPRKMNYIKVDLKKDGSVQLQPGDSLNIYDNRTYTNVGELRVSGAVKKPNSFKFDQSMTLKDMIINAGGLNVGAAYDRVEVFRVVLSKTEKTRLQMITLQIDSSYNIISGDGFSLRPYDHVVVRMTPDFTLGRTVEINGQVRYPGIYVLESKETTLYDVISMAGGLLEDADPYGAQLFRTYKNRGNVTIQLSNAVINNSQLKYNPILFEGDVLNINKMENTVTIMSEGTRIAQYTINPERTDSLKNVIFQGRKSAAWYVRNYAGGFQKNVDRMSVSVTYPNNQMQSTKNFLFFKIYPPVEPGSTITMMLDEEKIEKDLKPKEKVDWEATIAKGLSTLISSLSIILLLKQL